jgi:hypothetical protein
MNVARHYRTTFMASFKMAKKDEGKLSFLLIAPSVDVKDINELSCPLERDGRYQRRIVLVRACYKEDYRVAVGPADTTCTSLYVATNRDWPPNQLLLHRFRQTPSCRHEYSPTRQ